MTSINSVHSSIIISYHKGEALSLSTKMRLEALGIDPTTVSSEAEAQILIAQAEAAQNQNNSGHEQQGGNSQKQKSDTDIQQNIFNSMDMISLSNKLILGL